jgi:aryl-alcohol dehydrogenase-like predicted oxidoreductase
MSVVTSNPAVDGAIVGFRRSDQVDPIIDVANLELTDDDIAEIEGARGRSPGDAPSEPGRG